MKEKKKNDASRMGLPRRTNVFNRVRSGYLHLISKVTETMSLKERFKKWWAKRYPNLVCPECGGYMRECVTNWRDRDGSTWYADRPHGYKCVECSHYIARDPESQKGRKFYCGKVGEANNN